MNAAIASPRADKCPICGRFLIYGGGRYRCALHGSFSRKQLDSEDFKRTLAELVDSEIEEVTK